MKKILHVNQLAWDQEVWHLPLSISIFSSYLLDGRCLLAKINTLSIKCCAKLIKMQPFLFEFEHVESTRRFLAKLQELLSADESDNNNVLVHN